MKFSIKHLVIISLCGWLFVGCAKDGAVGPKGDIGAQGQKGDAGTNGAKGDAGAQGQKGETGNSDAKAYLFNTPFLFTESATMTGFTIPGLNAQAMDSLLVLGYYYVNVPTGGTDQFYWNPGGSLGPRGNYYMRFFYDQSLNQMRFNIRESFGGTTYIGPDVNVLKFKIVVIPANKINGRRAVNFSDYRSTMKLLGLSE